MTGYMPKGSLMKRLMAFTTFVLVCLTSAYFWGGGHVAGDDTRENTPVVDVIPVIRLDADSSLEVRLAFEAATEQHVRYLFRSEKHPIAFVSFHLLKDGTVLRSLRNTPDTFISERHVRELQPGDRLIHTLNLRELYGPLKPGMYTLEVRASGGPRDFGLSQIHLHRRALYVEVVEHKLP